MEAARHGTAGTHTIERAMAGAILLAATLLPTLAVAEGVGEGTLVDLVMAAVQERIPAARLYAPPRSAFTVERVAPTFAAPLTTSAVARIDLLVPRAGWAVDVAWDEERRTLGDPGTQLRLEVALRF